MATTRNLPIKFFQKREKDESSNEGNGGKQIRKWLITDNIPEKSVRFRQVLSSVAPKLDEKIAKNNYIPTVMRLRLHKKAKAKDPRKAISSMFNVEQKLNVIGINGNDELLIKIDNRNDLQKIIFNFSKAEGAIVSDTTVLSIGSIDDLEIFAPHVDVDTEPYTKVKVKLFNFGDTELNNIVVWNFEKFCSENNIQFSRTTYSADLNIYSIPSVSEDSLELLKEFDGIQSISDMPLYEVSFDELEVEQPINVRVPVEGKEYPVVGILDSGVAAIPHLKPWLTSESITYYPESDINKGHGTFVAGVLVYGDDLQGISYTGLEGCKIFEAIVIPDKNKQSISEDELIEQIRDAVSRNNHIKIWNLSLGTTAEADLHEFSDFATSLDEIQDHNNVLICKSAGNCENFKMRAPKSRISRSADTVRGIVVGSLAHDKNDTDDSEKHNPSPFSRKGPGPSYTIKPDLSHFGGNAGLDSRNNAVYNYVKSFSPNGSSASSIGTSFSTPRVTAIAAGVNFRLNEEFNPTLLKALLVHSAKYPSEMQMDITEKMKQVGFGLPSSIDDILYNEPNEITLILNDTLEKGKYIDILDFPFPKSMVDEDGYFYGEVTVTLVASPILDVSQGAEYCQSNIDVKFGTYDNKVAVDITQPRKKNPVSASNRINILGVGCYSTRKNKSDEDKFRSERMLLSYGSKYQPVKKWCVNFDEFTPTNKDKYLKSTKNWHMKIEGLYRHSLEEKLATQHIKPTQDFCCIVTIRDTKKKGNIYNEVTGLLDSYNFIHQNVKINQQVDIKINNNLNQ